MPTASKSHVRIDTTRFILLLTLALAGPTASGQTAATAAAKEPAPKTIRAHFACDKERTITATFINAAQNSVELVLSDGRTLSLPQGRSGSGARYVNADESIVFWNKGDTATLEEKGKVTYSGCTTA